MIKKKKHKTIKRRKGGGGGGGDKKWGISLKKEAISYRKKKNSRFIGEPKKGDTGQPPKTLETEIEGPVEDHLLCVRWGGKCELKALLWGSQPGVVRVTKTN